MVGNSFSLKVQYLRNLIWQICSHLFGTAKGKFYVHFEIWAN